MSSLKTNDIRVLEKLFSMEGGYVLNFINSTINDFFENDLNINFYDEEYSCEGNSKGKILKYLFKVKSDKVVANIILKLIEYIKSEIELKNLEKHKYPDDLIDKGNCIASKLQSNVSPNIRFPEEYINSEWENAIQRIQTHDTKGAITSSRTLVETVLKHILDERKIRYDKNINLPKLYKEVQTILNLAPEQHQEKVFKEILSGASKVVNGLGELRNKLGDAHGKTEKEVKPKQRHAELAVNLSGSMAIFLYKTHKGTGKKRSRSDDSRRITTPH